MRNSIQGPLLRTGNNSSFKALGETGYPVFKMAFQLREAIYRLDAGRDLARHLAIPQNDQGGDRTDWYSSFQGDIIPWSGATETERASARQQFSEFQMAVHSLSEQMLNAEKNGAGGDRRVFAQLLKSVVHFPDDEFLYLVNGVLVITFWGFVHQTGEQYNPIHWLQSSSVPAQMPLALAEQPLAQSTSTFTHTTETVTRTRPRTWLWNWRWLLWPLLALLLLVLLLGLLRGCMPSLPLPGLPGFSSEKKHSEPVSGSGESKAVDESIPVKSDVNVPVTTGDTTAEVRLPVSGSTEVSQTGVAAPAAVNTATSETATHAVTDTAQTQESADSHEIQGTEPAVNAAAETIPAVNPQAQNREPKKTQDVPHAVPPVVRAQGTQGVPLTLPATLPDGPARFLNGQWRVNGGIQDKLTGRPLQLQYNFDQGNGTVSVHQSSGVTCTGTAKGNVQQGALNITNPEQMKCSDGSNFIGPTIECKSQSSGHADCVGNNDGDKTFPIRMLQPNT